MGKPPCSNFRVLTANVLGCPNYYDFLGHLSLGTQFFRVAPGCFSVRTMLLSRVSCQVSSVGQHFSLPYPEEVVI